MKIIVLVLSSAPYSITENGRTNEGLSLTYIQQGEPENTPQKRGFDAIKESAPLAQASAIGEVPGIYEMTMTTKVTNDARGKKVQKIVPEYLTFIRSADLFAVPPVDVVGDRAPKEKAL